MSASSLALFTAAVSDGDALPSGRVPLSPKQLQMQRTLAMSDRAASPSQSQTDSSPSSLLAASSADSSAAFTASEAETLDLPPQGLRCGRWLCVQRRPLRRRAEAWLQLESSIRFRCVAYSAQFVYDTLLVCGLLAFLIDLPVADELPSLSGALPLVLTAAACQMLAALLDIACRILLMPDGLFSSWHERRPRVTYWAQLLSYLLATAGFLLLLSTLSGLVFPREDDSEYVRVFCLWVVAGCEALRLGLGWFFYRFLHLVFEHDAIPISCPFLPSWQSEQQRHQGSSDDSAPQEKSHPGFTRSQLQSIQPLPYCKGMRGRPEDENLCVICIGQMEEGDAVRIFSCRHCFHSECADDWLVRRKTCPLCVATVRSAAFIAPRRTCSSSHRDDSDCLRLCPFLCSICSPALEPSEL